MNAQPSGPQSQTGLRTGGIASPGQGDADNFLRGPTTEFSQYGLTPGSSPFAVESLPQYEIPALELPRGGGAIRGLAESLSTGSTGSAGFSVPLGQPPGRHGFGPGIALSYSSVVGNGAFGLGWGLGVGHISLRTEQGVPLYNGSDEVLLGADCLVQTRDATDKVVVTRRTVHGVEYEVAPFRPRVERTHTRIERWSNPTVPSDVWWRVLSGANVTTWYGRDNESRIADPDDNSRIAGWLPCLSYDDRGNAIRYHYHAEDSTGVNIQAPHEAGRTPAGRSAHRYLARISYANKTPFRPQLTPDGDPTSEPVDWTFHIVIDYGDHNDDAPSLESDTDWPVRPDPWSSHRTSFEVRLYRRCHRILIFHEFPELGVRPVLVSSTNLTYQTAANGMSLLDSVTRIGHGDEETAELPPLSMSYTEWRHAPKAEPVDLGELAGAPIGLDGISYEWVDLDGEGAPGICLRTPNQGWHFKRNLGPLSLLEPGGPRAQFAPPRLMPDVPIGLPTGGPGAPPNSRATFLDVDGDGRTDLLVYAGSLPGVAQRSGVTWKAFTPFDTHPIDGTSGTHHNARDGTALVDLTGDGRADLLVLDGVHPRWYPGLGLAGFAAAQEVKLAAERNEQVLLRADADFVVLLADMDGDGLVDLVEINRTSICYRPSLGHGYFGRTVITDDAPVLDTLEGFDPHRVLLGDVDGDGTADIIYLAGDGAYLHLNQSGNGWAPPVPLPGPPGTDNLTGVGMVDLFGSGTAALAWSTPVPQPNDRPMHYLNLAAAGKPYLLSGYDNGMGLSAKLAYLPSSVFALLDDLDGQPWSTCLPMPVQCLVHITTTDAPRGSSLTSRFSYHRGHYDGVERQFMGFGRVDQRDTEEHVGTVLDLPPVLVRRWFHTGNTSGQASLHTDRANYVDVDGPVLPDPVLPPGLDAHSVHHAVRAFAGSELRSEVYAEDGTPEAAVPYLVMEHTLGLRLLQPAPELVERPRGRRREAPVFQVVPSGEVSIASEREAADPRITQHIVLDTDDLGYVTSSATIVHPRRITDPGLPAEVTAAQLQARVICQSAEYTVDVLGDDIHRLRATFRTQSHELTGFVVRAGAAVGAETLRAAVTAATDQDPDAHGLDPSPRGLWRRLLARSEARFLADDLATDLPPGQLSAHGLLAQSFRLALTAPMATARFGVEVTAADLLAAGYTHLDGDDHWWLPSGRAGYSPDAAAHFLLPDRVSDALGVTSIIERRHDLLVTSVTNARGHRTEASYNLRVLQPDLLVDTNGNHTAGRFNPLGAVVATALMGKPGDGNGDTLDDPTVRYSYDLDRWRSGGLPPVVRTFAREEHGMTNTRMQESRTFLDATGAILGVKVQAPPGLAWHVDPATGEVSEVDTYPNARWVGTGRTVLNNKGLPIRQYEPYFSDIDEFDSAKALVEAGVSDLVHYDPLGRVRRVEHPDGTFEQIETHPWWSSTFDAVDTVLDSAWYAERGSPSPTGPEPTNPAARAAWMAAQSARTPAVTHADPLGRPMLQQSDNGAGDIRDTRVDADLSVLHTRIVDTRGRVALQTHADLLGRVLLFECAERGRTVNLVDVLGQLQFSVDAVGNRVTCGYDDLHRPTRMTTRDGRTGPDRLTQWVRFGDDLPGAAARNSVGKVASIFDEAGRVDVENYDFTGVPGAARRRFTLANVGSADWTIVSESTNPDTTADAVLEAETWTSESTQDALGRLTRVILPDATVLLPGYDIANRLTTLDVQPGGTGPSIRILAGQAHDAAGRVLQRRLGNGLRSDFHYDALTQRLVGLSNGVVGSAPLQALALIHDPLGHLTEIQDSAQQTRFFGNAVVSPDRRYTYDALYQLVAAEGRALAAFDPPTAADVLVRPLPHINDLQAVQRYREEYSYDDLGNLTDLRHVIAAGGGWRRRYRYRYESDPADQTNQLVATSVPGDADGLLSGLLGYDRRGNVTSLPHLSTIDWDVLGRLSGADLGGGGEVQYTYGVGGVRTRKVVDRGALVVETLYLGGAEVVRKRLNGVLQSERWTVLVPGDGGRIAQVDRETVSEGMSVAGAPVLRYVHGDTLGSVALVTDEQGRVVDYEEYTPYGTTAYRSSSPGENFSLKRYRFLDRERDDETGFSHLGARLYAPWLSRWVSPDPAGYVDGLNLYRYARNDPANNNDPNGTETEEKRQTYPIEQKVTTAEEVSNYLKGKGFDFTGPITEKSPGLWDAGKWLKVPGEGDDGGKTGADTSSVQKPGDSDAGGGTKAGLDASGSVGDTDGGKTLDTEGKSSPPSEEKDGGGTGEGGSALAQATPGAERFIWEYEFPGTGLAGTQRGRILERLLGVPWRDNTKGVDRIRGNAAQQIKSTGSFDNVAKIARAAVRSAEKVRTALPGGAGLRPQAVIVVPVDAPQGVNASLAAAHSSGKVPNNALPPKLIRGLPGAVGAIGKGLTGFGGLLAGYAFYNDISRGDASMAVGDGLSTMGGALEIYAIGSGGGTVLTVSAVSAGLAIGGVGIAIASGVSAYRNFQQGDTLGGAAGLIGLAAGLAITAGVIFGSPLLLAGGLIAAGLVGLFHLGRWMFGD